MSLLEAEDKIIEATDILSFLSSVTPHPGAIMCENCEHGNQLILFKVMDLLREVRSELKSHGKGAGA